MKLRDDIGLIDPGMTSLCLPPADKWVVAYHQVGDRRPPDREIPGCSTVYGVLVGISTAVPTPSPVPLGGSMACGASMPCGAGTSSTDVNYEDLRDFYVLISVNFQFLILIQVH